MENIILNIDGKDENDNIILLETIENNNTNILKIFKD